MEFSKKRLPYKPKIVSMSNSKSRSRDIAKLQSYGLDYEVSKPFSKQEFIKMCKEVNYDYKKAAVAADEM